MAGTTHTAPILHVPVLIGAPEALVCRRQKRTHYETNRDIKTWACWFVLKALTTSGHIRHYTRQTLHLMQVLECSEGVLRSHINRLRQLELATVDAARNLKLCSYRKAADILQIPYEGLEDNPIPYQWGRSGRTQSFAYSLRLREIENAKVRQLMEGLIRNVNNNPELEEVLMLEMDRQGIDLESVYCDTFQQWLLKMQQRTFSQGSEIYEQIHTYRADINRSVEGIQECHKYKCKTSVSYLKKILKKYNLARITKTPVAESTGRNRRFIDEGGRRRDGYKYNRSRKITLLATCDDISPILSNAA